MPLLSLKKPRSLAFWLAFGLACGCSSAAPSRQTATAPGTATVSSSSPAASNPSAAGGGSAFDQPKTTLVSEPPPPAMTSDDCNKVDIEFAPRVPSVFILVDRSSSMFERMLWSPLKDGVLAVVQQLAPEIRFGFSSYTGQAGMQCPDLSKIVPLAQQNYDAIKSAYDAIEKPTFKAETPTSLAIQQVTTILQKEPADNPKYIVLVTDGEPDFCDDPNVTCSRDAVVGAAQAAYMQGIGTFIISVGGEVDKNHLADVANAGAGQPVTDRQMAVHYQCPNMVGSYSDTSGNAPYFEPDVNDRGALVNTLSGTIAAVRSCVFDLQGKIKIDLSMADQGMVAIDGTHVSYGGSDGYRMNSATQLELLGSACQLLKDPKTKHVSIDFPCKAIELL
jgi:hypothetical protein